MLDDAGGHDFLSRVAALFHEAAGEAFYDGARGLAEAFHLVTSGCVGEVGGMVSLAGNVILCGSSRV